MSMSDCLLVCIIVGALLLPNIIALEEDEAKFYELKHGNLSVRFTNFGARIVSLSFPDKHGKLADIVLGHDSILEYMHDKHQFGAIVGRVTNVIKGAQFTMNGTLYKVSPNYGKNTLNGGYKGFGYQVWKMTNLREEKRYSQITFTHKSTDGEAGFPGDLIVNVKFTLQSRKLITEVNAYTENKATPINIGQHVSWNLGGQNNGKNVLSHDIQIFGSKFIDVDKKSFIPTGKILSVKGTPYDFQKIHEIGSRIKKTGEGYKLNYVLNNNNNNNNNNNGTAMKLAAILYEKSSGRILKLWTTQTTLLFTTSNGMKEKGKRGSLYGSHAGCALDPQDYPDSLNHHNFPSTFVTKDKPYKHRTIFKFSIKA